MVCRDTQFFPSLATQSSACSLSCSWGSQAGLHISGSVALAELLASPPSGLSQVSTVQQEGWWGHGASMAYWFDEHSRNLSGNWANGLSCMIG